MLRSLCPTFQNGTLSGNSLNRDNQVEMRGGGSDSTDLFIKETGGTVDMYRGTKTQRKMGTEGRQGENTQGEDSHAAEGVQPRNAKN